VRHVVLAVTSGHHRGASDLTLAAGTAQLGRRDAVEALDQLSLVIAEHLGAMHKDDLGAVEPGVGDQLGERSESDLVTGVGHVPHNSQGGSGTRREKPQLSSAGASLSLGG
jgi:hypothetical protein